MTNFSNKTVFITGASRGIGLAIGLRLAREGANIVITGKTTDPHPKLPGTIYSSAEDIEKAGGKALPIVMDVRDDEQVEGAVQQTVDRFGGIDILINNASAIMLTPTEMTPMKRYDLMQDVNVRGTFLTSRLCIPHLRRAENPHILVLSPPIELRPDWLAPHLAYTMSKFGMSMCALGLAHELKRDSIAVNALWPRTTIATAAVNNLLGGDDLMRRSRTPEIVADAAYHIFSRNSRAFTGNFCIDEDILAEAGITDLSSYAVDGSQQLQNDLFVD